MDVLSTDDVRLAVHDLGGDGPPFLLCHATGFCGPAYQPLAAELAGSFHVWAIDFRGHGDSTAPTGDRFHWDGMTDDLLAAVEALGRAPIDVFGHSLGGGVAMLAEHRRPGTLRTAYLFEPIVIPALEGPRPEGPQFMSIAARRRRPSFPTKAEALYRYASRPPLDELRTSALYAYVEHGFADGPDGGVVLKCLPEHEALTFEADGKPTLDTVRTVMTPTTVAIGTTAEEWTPALYGASIAEALPNGRLEQHPSLGHFGPLQDPIAIAAAIIATARL